MIKKLFRKIQQFIGREARAIKKLYNSIAVEAIEVGQKIKEALDNPQFDVIVNFTKTNIDNQVLAALRAAMRIMLPLAKIDSKNFGKILKEFIEELRKQSGPIQQANLSKIGALVASELAKKQGIVLTHNEADILINMAYHQFKEGKIGTPSKPVLEPIIEAGTEA